MIQGRARLTQVDFDSMVSGLAGQQSQRLDLGWVNPEDSTWANELRSDFGPKLVANGSSAVFSTCQDIERWPTIVWDVNGYYSALGVRPGASKKEITQAYLDRVGLLQDDGDRVRLTYIYKVMLDPERRTKYDGAPLGSVFNDPFVAEAIRLSDAWETSQKLLRGEVSFDELMDMQEALDADAQAVEDDFLARSRETGLTAQNAMIGGGQWMWSYYVLDSTCDDHQRLARWQALLVRYLSRKRKGIHIAVGFVGGTESSYEVHAVGFRTVVFLNDKNRPTRRQAKQAAATVVKHIKGSRVTSQKGATDGLS